ncbi:uncharacterized protein GGS22DRAFT_40096 [Annulohypoxylon maeteangense]|uniref:uncharacterized protein n=1 Tax=Annulohypoxylon maeteangense TaxID=1927788 RepID=UPI0020085CB8|nr:uncharacterized protein GGS22DRAFT_40096 [Annulohypoxylon maeteangense]KAI0882752.1 hypothetical protein GGS22DRAFT_40096 [Annulohypoxylon maeteangense]
MNPENTSTNSSSGGPATPTNSRKERGAIAAQACESCRQRKQRCSEERPKCATCQRMNLECKYREPQPTKKDKTLVEILERLKSLEGGLRNLDGKVDSLNSRGTLPLSIYGPIQSHHPTTTLDASRSSAWPATNIHLQPQAISPASPRDVQYVSATHKMLSWPVMQQVLESQVPNLDLASLEKDGAAMLLGLQGRVTSLPTNVYESAHLGIEGTSFPLQVAPGSSVDGMPTGGMSWDTMQRLTKSYFDTFNLIYPILDRQVFQSEILPTIANQGFDDSSSSTLACLIFALGEVAISAIQGAPITTHKGRSSGIRGGTVERPPGLLFFNEARKRMGFNLTECSLENVQMFSLAAIYYGTCCHHLEFWRMTTSASLACQALLTSNPEELTTHRGDLVRRAFWHCSIMETCLNMELNIPQTGLNKLEGLVGLPDFSGSFSEEDYIGNQASHFQEHFASQIVLRRLSVEFHTTLTNAFGPTHLPVEPPISSAAAMMKNMASQLDQWRGLLPVYLRWEEENPGAFSTPAEELYDDQSMYPPPVPDLHTNFMFSADLDNPPVTYPYAVDIQTANLRTRYYYVKYLIYRPFIFKALHHPEQVTHDDAEGVAECLKAMLKWPITMSPTCFHKRLIPCLFFWSQNLLGVLLILHLTQKVPILLRIRTSLMGTKFDQDANETAVLCIDWIRDLKDTDATSLWCWEILKGVYSLGDDT